MAETLKTKPCFKTRIGSCFLILALLFKVGCGGGGGGGGVAAAPDESLAVSQVHAIFSQEYFDPAAVRAPVPGDTVQHYVDSYRSPTDIYTGYLNPQELAEVAGHIETPENLVVRLYGTTQYVCFEKFVSGTAGRVIEAVEANIALGFTTLVLDLRVNTGGLPGEVEELGNYFMGSLVGPAPLFSIDGPAVSLNSILPLAAPGAITENTFDAGSMIVLTSGLTASASEILVAGLVYYGEARQVGSSTFGKNRTISLFTDPVRGDGFYITTGIVWHADQLDLSGQPLPGQSDREGVGLAPDPQLMDEDPFGWAGTEFGFNAPDPLTTDWNVSPITLANLYDPSFWREQAYMAAGLAPAKRIRWLPEFMGVPEQDPTQLP